MPDFEPYLRRAFFLSGLGAGHVAPNPMVGAVLVHGTRIIGEGWHRRYGSAHAEVNAVASVRPEDRALIVESTLFVSLEPCCIHGNTPPCTDLILRERIPRVVVACTDDTPGVAGHGLQRLREAGVEVHEGVLSGDGRWLARRRNTYVREKRPYLILKWAHSMDGYLGRPNERVLLTGPLSQRLSHRWRTEEAAILVGTNTLLSDDPQLTARLWPGRSPLRIALDWHGRTSPDRRIFDNSAPTLLATRAPRTDLPATVAQYVGVENEPFAWPPFLRFLYETLKIQSLLVEGGGHTLQCLLDEGLWDEARVLEAPLSLGEGIPAPRMSGGELLRVHASGADRVSWWRNKASVG